MAKTRRCLRLYDLATGKISNVFSPAESPFSRLSYHFEWSKGGERRVAFVDPLKEEKGSASATMDVDKGIASLKMIEPDPDSPRVFDGLSLDWQTNDKTLVITGVVEGRPISVSILTTAEKSAFSFDGIPENVVVRDPDLHS